MINLGKSPLEILRKAKDLLTKHGWTQNTYIASDGKLCSLGALRMAEKGNAVAFMDRSVAYHDACNFLAQAISATIHIPTFRYDIPIWNDNVYRLESEVLAAFDAAILLAEAV